MSDSDHGGIPFLIKLGIGTGAAIILVDSLVENYLLIRETTFELLWRSFKDAHHNQTSCDISEITLRSDNIIKYLMETVDGLITDSESGDASAHIKLSSEVE